MAGETQPDGKGINNKLLLLLLANMETIALYYNLVYTQLQTMVCEVLRDQDDDDDDDDDDHYHYHYYLYPIHLAGFPQPLWAAPNRILKTGLPSDVF